jgi:THO complex subunit 2
MTFGIVSDINLAASNEVRRVLQNNNIGVSLLILLSQVRHSIIFQKQERPIPVKLIGNLVDASQVVISILLDFLTNEVDTDGAEIGAKSIAIREFSASLPTLVELQHQYKVEVASSWSLCRPLMRAARASKERDGKLAKHLSSAIPFASLSGMVPKSVWKHIGTELFELFFTSSTYDIFCPSDVYENEIVRLERETERLSQKKNTPPPSSIQPGAVPEKSDREEYERVTRMVVGLKKDYAKQKEHVSSIHETMLQKLPNFFVSSDVTMPSAMAFFTRCVFPRCMQGPDDAMYCAHFASLMHQNATPGFSTLHYFDALIQIVPRSLYCLTEGEAACASILLLDTWKIISKWRYDGLSFENDLLGKPGSFFVKDVNSDPVMVTKHDYENLYNKWHAAMGDTLVGCLRSKEYMHLRCGLIVLTRIVDEYPTRPRLANSLLEALEPLTKESNGFADIRASSQAYSMQLLRSRDNGVWKEEDAATVQARLASVEAAAMERQKKAQEQMKQIERDSEKITEKIGVSESRVRGRGPVLLRSNSDERLNRSNVGASDANRRRAATSSSVTVDDTVRIGGTSGPAAASGGAGASSFSTYASIAPQAQTGESSTASTTSAGRTLEGRWQHASGSTPPRNPVSSTSATTDTKSGTTVGTNATTTNTRKRGRTSSSPTGNAEQTENSTTTKRSKLNQSDGDGKRTRGRHGGSRRS